MQMHTQGLQRKSARKVILKGTQPQTQHGPCCCRYTYNIAEEVEARRQAPTQMQQRIGQLLMERRQQQRHDQSAGAPSNSSTGKPG